MRAAVHHAMLLHMCSVQECGHRRGCCAVQWPACWASHQPAAAWRQLSSLVRRRGSVHGSSPNCPTTATHCYVPGLLCFASSPTPCVLLAACHHWDETAVKQWLLLSGLCQGLTYATCLLLMLPLGAGLNSLLEAVLQRTGLRLPRCAAQQLGAHSLSACNHSAWELTWPTMLLLCVLQGAAERWCCAGAEAGWRAGVAGHQWCRPAAPAAGRARWPAGGLCAVRRARGRLRRAPAAAAGRRRHSRPLCCGAAASAHRQ